MWGGYKQICKTWKYSLLGMVNMADGILIGRKVIWKQSKYAFPNSLGFVIVPVTKRTRNYSVSILILLEITRCVLSFHFPFQTPEKAKRLSSEEYLPFLSHHIKGNGYQHITDDVNLNHPIKAVYKLLYCTVTSPAPSPPLFHTVTLGKSYHTL